MAHVRSSHRQSLGGVVLLHPPSLRTNYPKRVQGEFSVGYSDGDRQNAVSCFFRVIFITCCHYLPHLPVLLSICCGQSFVLVVWFCTQNNVWSGVCCSCDLWSMACQSRGVHPAEDWYWYRLVIVCRCFESWAN